MNPAPSDATTFISAASSNSPYDARLDLVLPKPFLERAPHRSVLAWHQGWRAVQRAGEVSAQGLRQRGRSGEGERRFCEQMIKRTQVVTAGRRFVGEDDIEAVHAKLRQQIPDLALAADDMHRLRGREERLQDIIRHQLRERIRQTYVQPPRARRRAVLDRVHQFAAQRKDLLRVAKHHLARIGQHLAASALPKERLA
jgi:hypothetical protein